MRTLLVVCILSVAATTRAQDAAQNDARPDATAPEAVATDPNPTPPEPPAPARSARHSQAHADRVLLAPTAETHPAGTLFASTYDIVLLQLGYAFSDRFQAELATVPFFLPDGAFFELAFKANVLRSRWLRAAVVTAIDHLHVANAEDEDGNEEPRDIVAGRAGLTLQLCFDLACASSLSATAVGVAQAETEIVWPIAFSAGFTARMGEDLSLLLEYSTMHNIGEDAGLIGLPVYTVGYALRVATADTWALDLGFVRELASDEQFRLGRAKFVDVVGVPFGAFTYRWLP